MFRWLDELRHPEKACARKGHRIKRWVKRVYLWPPMHAFSHVADRADEVHARCSRCGHAEPVATKRLGGLNKLSMASEKWDRLREIGRVECGA